MSYNGVEIREPLFPEGNLIKSFEGVRGLAALLVALFHLHSLHLFSLKSNFFSLITNGYIFVDLFFVLSGYIIFCAYSNQLNNRTEIINFIIRRFGRLFPLMIFSSFAFIVVHNVTAFAEIALNTSGHNVNFGLSKYLIPSAPEIISTLTLTHGLGFFDRLILNYATWSISTEFYTYLFFIVCWKVLGGRIRLIVLATISVLSLGIADWTSIHLHDCLEKFGCGGATFDFGILRCIGSFVLGIFTSMIRKPSEKLGGFLQVAALIMVVGLFAMVNVFAYAMFAAPVIFALLIYSLSPDRGFLSALFSRKIFQMLGERSYSIYLLHPIILMILGAALRQAPNPVVNALLVLAYLPVVTIAAGWTYRHIENPMRNYFNSLAVSNGYTRSNEESLRIG